MPTLERLEELAGLLESGIALYLRYSPGPVADTTNLSTDHESGLVMPGLSANPLRVPRWWTLPPEDWLARRICQYLREIHQGSRPWVLTGKVVDFGPDNEPLLDEVEPIAWLSAGLVRNAHERYHQRLDAGRATP